MIQTLIFFDLETTGLIKDISIDPLLQRPRPGANRNLTTYLTRLIELAGNSAIMPKILEMSFMSVPRSVFVESCERLLTDHTLLGNDAVTVDVTANVHTRQLNPLLNEHEWAEYEREKNNAPNVMKMQKSDLLTKNTFSEEWPGVHHLLKLAPKPACLIAHNGTKFDYRVLFNELQRFGILEDYPIPDQVYFMDSYLALVDIEKDYHNSVKFTTSEMNWRLVTQLIMSTEAASRTTAQMEVTNFVQNHRENSSSTESNQPLAAVRAPAISVQLNSVESTEINVVETSILQPPVKAEANPVTPTKTTGGGETVPRRGKRLQFNLSDGAAHPLSFMRLDRWSPAKRRRVSSSFFERSNEGDWAFNEGMANAHFYGKGNFKLENLFKQLTGCKFPNVHRAQADCGALLQVAMAYGQDFVKYMDRCASELPAMFRPEKPMEENESQQQDQDIGSGDSLET